MQTGGIALNNKFYINMRFALPKYRKIVIIILKQSTLLQMSIQICCKFAAGWIDEFQDCFYYANAGKL